MRCCQLALLVCYLAACSGDLYDSPNASDSSPGFGQQVATSFSEGLGPGAFDHRFAHTAALSGNTLAVGVERESSQVFNGGGVYIYETMMISGAQQYVFQKLVHSDDLEAGDLFGRRLDLDGDTLVVYAEHTTSDSGAVYVFGRNVGGADNWGQVKRIDAPIQTALNRFGQGIAIDGDLLVVGARGDNQTGNDAGKAYMYGRNVGGNDNWGMITELINPDLDADDQYGFSADVSGNYAIVGAIKEEGGGKAYLFEKDQGGTDNWGLLTTLGPSTASPHEFGYSVALSATANQFWAAVGHPQDDPTLTDAGSVSLFERDSGGANNFGQVKVITASAPVADAYFGYRIRLSGDKLAVSALNEFTLQAPPVELFGKDEGGANNWGHLTSLTPSKSQLGDHFGYSLAFEADTVIAGADYFGDRADREGTAFVFSASQGNAWSETQQLMPEQSRGSAEYARAIAASDEWLVVGAPSSNSSDGASYVYRQTASGGLEFHSVLKESSSHLAGAAVDIWDDTIVVGSPYYLSSIGRVDVYRYDVGSDTWQHTKALAASDGVNGDRFGTSVAVAGEWLFVGAPEEADNGNRAGAVYLFQRDQGGVDNWGEVKRLNVDWVTANTSFGFALDASNEYVAVGAPGQGRVAIFARDYPGMNNWGDFAEHLGGGTFGNTIAVENNEVLVGDDGATASLLEVSGANASLVQSFPASDLVGIDIRGDRIVLGRIGENNLLFQRGAGANNQWGQTRELQPRPSSDNAGVAVALMSSGVVIGDPTVDAYGTGSGEALFFRLTDSDRDGIDDDLDNCPAISNPSQTDSDADGVGDACLIDDADGDGLSDSSELAAGTNPLDADSDDDGVRDGDEPNWNEDSDADGVINALDPDADNDGLLDGTELGLTTSDVSADATNFAAGFFRPDSDAGQTTTDPLNNDSDAGGASDSAEDSNLNGVVDNGESDPNNGGDDGLVVDSDGDGFSDNLEAVLGTDASDADSDDDGIIDGAEPNGTVDSDGDGFINALDPDSDDDAILDGTERGFTTADADTYLAAGFFLADADPTTQTSMLLYDTDGGGIGDGVEDCDGDGKVGGVTGCLFGDGASERNPLNPLDDNGIPLTFDSDGDTIPDPIEGRGDFDKDGKANYLDDDADDDGIDDATEAGDSLLTTAPIDTDAYRLAGLP